MIGMGVLEMRYIGRDVKIIGGGHPKINGGTGSVIDACRLPGQRTMYLVRLDKPVDVGGPDGVVETCLRPANYLKITRG